MLLNICNDPNVLSVMHLIVLALSILKVVVPLIIIILVIIDYCKVVIKGDGFKDTNIIVFKRILAAILIFLIPTLIQFFASLTDDSFDYSKCVTNANLEGINNAYRSKMNSYIDVAYTSLSIDDYNEAVAYSKQIKDEKLRVEVLEELSTLKEKVDMYNDVGKLSSSDNKPSTYIHSSPFYIKIVTDKNIYYCIDKEDSCEPNIMFVEQLWFAKSGKEYLRYKLCNDDNECSKIASYEISIVMNLMRPSVSTSWGGFGNPMQAAYYYQCDDRWKNYDVYSGVTMCDVGCGYGAYSMLMTGITHDYSITPVTLFEKLSSIRKEHGVEFQSLATGGGLLNTAIHENSYIKKEFGYKTEELWNDYEYKTADNIKKEKIVESLKMGHMIFMRVPVHFISLVGIDEDQNILVFDPGWKSWKLDIDTLYSTYYDYNGNCSDGEECGTKIAYEVYPSGGISLNKWMQ